MFDMKFAPLVIFAAFSGAAAFNNVLQYVLGFWQVMDGIFLVMCLLITSVLWAILSK